MKIEYDLVNTTWDVANPLNIQSKPPLNTTTPLLKSSSTHQKHTDHKLPGQVDLFVQGGKLRERNGGENKLLDTVVTQVYVYIYMCVCVCM